MSPQARRAAAALLAAALAAWAAVSISRFAAAGFSCFDLSYAEPGEALLHAVHPGSLDVSFRLPLGMIFEALGVFHAGDRWVRAACWLLAGGILLMTALSGWLLGGIWQALAAGALWLSVFDSLPKHAGFFKQLLLTFQISAFACALALPLSSRMLSGWASACGLGATFLTRSTLIFFAPLWTALERFWPLREKRMPLWAPAAAYLFLLPWAFMNWRTQGRLQLLEGGAANMNIVTGALGTVTGAHGDYQTPMGADWSEGGSVTLWAMRRAAAAPAATTAAVGRRLAFVFGLRPILLMLALIGFWRLRQNAGAVRLALLAAYLIGVHCLMSVEDNYFEPLWPLLAALAGGLLASRRPPPAGRLALAGALSGPLLSLFMALAAAGVVLRYAALAGKTPPTSPQALERALIRSPGDAWLLLQKGRLDLRQGHPEKAEADLARAAAARPDFTAARLESAWVQFEQGKAEPLLEGSFEGGIRQEDLPLRLRLYRTAAALRLGRETRARKELEEALLLWKRSRSLLHGASTAQEQTVASLLLQEAEARFAAKAQRLLEGKPLSDLIAVQSLLGRLCPDQPALFLEAARLAGQIGRPRQALAELRKAERLPLTRDQRLALAEAFRQARDAASAQRVLAPLLEEKPAAEVWVEQADIFALAGLPRKAVAALEKAASPANGPEDDHRLALAFQRLGRPRRAISLLENLARRRPLDAVIRGDLGLCRHLAGDSIGAIADLKLALRLDPRHWPAALTLGAVYSARGEPALAKKVYEAALSQPAPAYPDAAWELLNGMGKAQAPK